MFTPFYFTKGIPIFRRQANSGSTINALPSADQLESATGSGIYTRIAFRQLDGSRFAFRERILSGFFKLTYTPIMHGLLEFDRDSGQVRVTGFANWFPVALVTVFAFNLPQSEIGIFAAFLLGLLVLIYALQARRFSQVATAAAARWCSTADESLTTKSPSSRRAVGAVGTIWRILTFAAVGVVLVPMALMLIGTFTEEWTCREEGSDWKCVGGRECNAEATKRFDSFRRTVSCKRADWPMVPIDHILELLFPGRANDKAGA